jgi:murein DD-endopeptidase MepM/ murein hydrolase activator NlpD
MGLRFEILNQRSLAHQESPRTVVTLVEDSSGCAFVGPMPAQPKVELRDPSVRVIRDTLRRDDSIYSSLKQLGVPELQIAQLTQALGKVFDAKNRSRPRDSYALTADQSGQLREFRYVSHAQPEKPILVERNADGLHGRRLNLPLERRTEVLELVIVDNLSNAMNQVGESDVLTDLLADKIFGAVIDFQKDPREGDRLGVVFEKLYQDHRFVRYGDVRLARYEGEQVSKTAVSFDGGGGAARFYDVDGNALRRPFLLKPLSFRRISSRFNRRRFHPILKKTIAHLGTDYAARRGTTVWATARGRVVHAGWKGSYGKMVEIEHANGYRTRFAHLSRVKVRRGQAVGQYDTIGLVGATGRATGPHLHYELIKNGRHIDPNSVNRGIKGTPLADDHHGAFVDHRDRLLDLLEATSRLRSTQTVLASGI